MALIIKPVTMVAGHPALAADVNADFDTLYNDYNGNVQNVNIAANAGIVDSKLSQIATFRKVHGTALDGLDTINSQAGVIPVANLPAPDMSLATGTLATAHGGTGSTANANAASGVVVLDASSKLPAVDGSQLTNLPINFDILALLIAVPELIS